MRGWGQPPLVMIRPGEDALDACLAARGYLQRDPTLLAAAPAAALAATPRENVILGPAPLAVMAEIWDAGGIGPAPARGDGARARGRAPGSSAGSATGRPPAASPPSTATSRCCTRSRSPPSRAGTGSAPR